MAFTWTPTAAVTMSDITTNPANKILAYVYNAVLSAAGNAAFRWQVATYQSTSPAYLMLSRKDGSAGRILLFGQTGSTPAAASTYVTPAAGALYLSYAPSSTSNVITTSYLTAIPLADSDYIRGIGFNNILLTNSTRTDYRLVIYDSPAGLVFGITNPTTGSVGVCLAGELMLDYNNTALSCCSGNETTAPTVNWVASGTDSNGLLAKTTINVNNSFLAGNPSLIAKINGGLFQLFRTSILASSNNTNGLYDAASGQSWYLPQIFSGPSDITTLGQAARLRQMGYGPNSVRDAVYVDNATSQIAAYPITPSTTLAQPSFWLLNKDI